MCGPTPDLGERPAEDNQSFQYDHEAFLGKEDSKTSDQSHLGGEQGEAGAEASRSGTPQVPAGPLGPGRAGHRPQSESETRRRDPRAWAGRAGRRG